MHAREERITTYQPEQYRSMAILVVISSSQTHNTLTARQAIVILVHCFFHRLEKKDLHFLLRGELEAVAEHYQLLVPAEFHCLLVRNQEAKLGQFTLYI